MNTFVPPSMVEGYSVGTSMDKSNVYKSNVYKSNVDK